MKKKAIFFCNSHQSCLLLAEKLLKKNWEIFSSSECDVFFENVSHKKIFSFEKESENFLAYLELLSEITTAGNYCESGSDDESDELLLLCVEMKFEQKKRNDSFQSNFVGSVLDEKIASLVLAASKNYKQCIVLCDEADIDALSYAIETETLTEKFRLYLAEKALNALSANLAFASRVIAEQIADETHPKFFLEPYKKMKSFESGASLYAVPKYGSLSTIKKVQGPDASEQNFCDIDALSLFLQNFFSLFKSAREVSVQTADNANLAVKLSAFSDSVFAIATKHGIPIGAALGESAATSFSIMHERSKFVSDIAVIAFSSVVDDECAKKIIETNCLCVLAPLFTAEAKSTFARKPCTLLMMGRAQNFLHTVQAFDGALLVKNKIANLFDTWHVVTKNFPEQADIDTLAFAQFMLLGAKTSAAVVAHGMSATGMCSCALRASDACFAALEHALENEKATGEKSRVLVASDRLSFTENFSYFYEKGIRVIAECGGDAKDNEFIDFCNERGMILIFTKIKVGS